MKDFFNFFFSFDKLMKTKLVPAFYWAAIIYFGINFSRNFLDGIQLDWLAWITGPLEFFAKLVMVFVGLRLACELAIAIFRINDNLSPDGGISESADIDPLAEARKAAEDAAKRAREVTGKAVDKTKAAASNMKESTSKTTHKAAEKADDVVDDVEDAIEEAVEKVKAAAKKTTAKKTTTKKPAAKTTAPKTTTAKKTSAKKTTPKK